MLVKIPTLVQMKKDRVKKVTEHSTMGFLNTIHAGLCNRLEYIDIPFNVLNDEDRKILDSIIEGFKSKDYNFEKINEIPFQAMTPMGLISGVNVIHRFQLEPRIKFIEKKDESAVKLGSVNE